MEKNQTKNCACGERRTNIRYAPVKMKDRHRKIQYPLLKGRNCICTDSLPKVDLEERDLGEYEEVAENGVAR